MIDRRAFVATVTLGALAAPRAGRGQQSAKVPRVGSLYMVSAEVAARSVRVRDETFRELGHLPGKTVVLEARFAGGNPGRLRRLAAELVKMEVDVIIAGNNATIAAAKEATSAIPIVMVASSDPVRAGFVQSLARPGGNITGLTADAAPETMLGKQIGLVREMLPGLTRLAVLWNPEVPIYGHHFKRLEAIARPLGIALQSLEFSDAADFETLFPRARENRVEAMVIIEDHVIITHYRAIAALGIKYRLPTIGYHREFVEAAGLMCYGVDLMALGRRAVYYADRILKGAKPGDLPVEQPATFEMVINLKTAKALGVAISRSLRLQADQIIE